MIILRLVLSDIVLCDVYVCFIQQSVKTIYNDFEEYGSPIDCSFCTTIRLKVTSKPDGWTVNPPECEVNILNYYFVCLLYVSQ